MRLVMVAQFSFEKWIEQQLEHTAGPVGEEHL